MGCIPPEQPPSKKMRHDAPAASTAQARETQPPTMPTAVKNSTGVLEDGDKHTELEDTGTELRRLQKRLSELNTKFRKVLNLIQEADDKAQSNPEKAPTLLHEIRQQTERLRGSRDGAIPAVAVVPVVDYFSGKDEKDVSSMLVTLLRQLAPSSPPFSHNTASTLLRYLHAREKADQLMTSAFKGDIIECKPLDNLVSALVDYPDRISEKWRLEWSRLCDFSRALTLPCGSYSMPQMRYSKVTSEFCETVGLKCSKTVYKLLFACGGNDPDHGSAATLVGPSHASIMVSIRNRTGVNAKRQEEQQPAHGQKQPKAGKRHGPEQNESAEVSGAQGGPRGEGTGLVDSRPHGDARGAPQGRDALAPLGRHDGVSIETHDSQRQG
jgi:hypothetical protein